MRKKSQLMLAVMAFVVGVVLISYPIVQLLPTVEEAVTVSILDRFGLAGRFEQELKPGEYVSIVDEKTGEVLDKTARTVYPGDELITEANTQYRVVRVKRNTAYAANRGVASDLVYREEWDALPAVSGAEPAQRDLKKTQVAIYFTHSDESYVPTDGTETKPAKGGILQVGEALAQRMRNDGVNVTVDKTPHEPHDSNAYHRSRKTAVKLLEKRPVALLDVHRDGVPDPDFYNQKINGEDVTKIRLVVGRQNPKMSSNLEFAKNVKAFMDKHEPGLIKGIFIGRGNYNQDLGPKALLLEVGTHTNDRPRAERGAAIFADAFPQMLNLQGQPGAAPGGAGGAVGGENSNAWKTLAWIVGALLVGGAAFLFISTGSLKGAKSKLGELRKTEFANFFGLKKVNRKKK